MTKLTNTMHKYLIGVYDSADFITRLIWRLKIKFMSDEQIMKTYYELTDRR